MWFSMTVAALVRSRSDSNFSVTRTRQDTVDPTAWVDVVSTGRTFGDVCMEPA